jgi:hypothetical protein
MAPPAMPLCELPLWFHDTSTAALPLPLCDFVDVLFPVLLYAVATAALPVLLEALVDDELLALPLSVATW